MPKDNDYECLPQYFSALAISMGSCVVGGWMAWTSVAIPKMMNITLTSDQNSSSVFSSQEDDPISIDPCKIPTAS